MKKWEIDKIYKSNSGEIISIEVKDKKYGETSVSFKWDGCIDFRQYQNGYKVDDEYTNDKARNTQYIHICDINDMIEKLQEIKKIAEENFEKENINLYWNNTDNN